MMTVPRQPSFDSAGPRSGHPSGSHSPRGVASPVTVRWCVCACLSVCLSVSNGCSSLSVIHICLHTTGKCDACFQPWKVRTSSNLISNDFFNFKVFLSLGNDHVNGSEIQCVFNCSAKNLQDPIKPFSSIKKAVQLNPRTIQDSLKLEGHRNGCGTVTSRLSLPQLSSCLVQFHKEW